MLGNLLEYQRHRLFLWVPVMFGLGIGFYFQASTEPANWQLTGLAVIGAVLILLTRRKSIVISVLLAILGFISLGYSYAGYRTGLVEAPVLGFRYYGPIEGTIKAIDRSATNAVRITLEDVYLPGVNPLKTPINVRISLQGFIPEKTVEAGARVTLTGGLSPPGAPVEPRGFDFRRMAWFMQLGAVGYTRNPVIPAAGDQAKGFSHWIFAQRMRISKHIQTRIEGQNGAFAAAILTGDRSGIDPSILEGLRATNLAHLLAISGLHMGLLSGFVFTMTRSGIALFPRVALRVRAKKISAVIALAAGLGYLLLSGANVATQRAFIMTAVVLIAVLLDRPAFTLRAVALAALIVLIIKPYSLLEAGFQMSFAATTALIAVFEWLRGQNLWLALQNGHFKILQPFAALVITSSVAGLATAPVSAFHFNQISQYGLVANLLAVPIMGALVMPSAVIAGVLSIVGADGFAFTIMGHGVGLILRVAEYVSNLDNATRSIRSAPPMVLAIMGGGGVVLALWRGRGKFIGVGLLVLSMFLWANTPRPILFISEDARLFSVLTTAGRIPSKPRGSGYAVKIWLENDGDNATQKEAFTRAGLEYENDVVRYNFPTLSVILYSGKSDVDARKLCTQNTLVIVSKVSSPQGKCTSLDTAYLKTQGTLAVAIDQDQFVLTGSKQSALGRPWGQN